jgi:hypothetical protein
MILSNLGALLDSRFEQTQEPRTLHEAIRYHRDSVAVTPPDHSERGKHLSNLAISLLLQARLTGEDPILDEASLVSRQALDLLPTGDPGRAQTLLVLGAAHERRFEQTGNAESLSEGSTAFREAAEDSTAPAQIRISAGRDGGRLAASAGSVDDAVAAYGTAVQLIDEAAWIGIGREDQERLLSQLAGLPMDAAAMAIEAGHLEYAVELLEQGRGVLLARQLEMPAQHAALQERAPDLAERLAELQQALNTPTSSDLIPEDDQPRGTRAALSISGQRNDLARQRDSLIRQIRSQSNLADIVAPPRFSRLREAAAQGPVVILNVSTYRCDALIVSPDEVRLIPLPDLNADEVNERTKALFEAVETSFRDVTPILGWLWDSIVQPIFSGIGITSRPSAGQQFPHLWWCPTGAAVFLPLHAAGHYPDGSLGPDTALDLATSSYTPTLRTLIQLRERHSEPASPENGPLIIAMPRTPGAPDLPDAEKETEDLASRFPSNTHLSGSAATYVTVTEAMRHHPWAHFSCHGAQNLTAPSHGKLLLHDQPLTIQQIMNLHLTDASFAFLSACETYRGGTGIPDEGVTLASALQLAGYQHVIATLWQISGLTAAEISGRVYDQTVRNDNGTTLIAVGSIAAALRAAITALREESPTIPPMYWAAHIHTGP